MITVLTAETPAGLAEALADKPTKMYMYLEFANNSSFVPAYTTAASIPNFANPKTYYSSLSTRLDYLRVPAIRQPTTSSSVVGSTYSTSTIFVGQSFPPYTSINNALTFTTGSICYGAALVLVPDENDRTKDLIIARAYFTPSSEYLVKTASSEVFVSFPFTSSVTSA